MVWPVEYLPQRLTVLPAGYYTEYEKLIMPFDLITWILIASTFVDFFLTILILYFVKRSIKDFVIGSNITTQSLNVIQNFFGISRLARYLTMLFILFCINTAWQEEMCEFVQKDIAKPEIQTIEQMIEQGHCTFNMESDFDFFNQETEIAKRGTIDLEFTYDNIEDKIFETGFKGALQTNPTYETDMAVKTKGQFAKRLRKEVLVTTICDIKPRSHHHFTGIIDLKSQQLFTAGIIQHATENVGKEIKAQTLKHLIIQEPRVLNMEMPEPGFMNWSTSLTLTFIAFALECLLTLEDYIVAKYILQEFLRMQLKIETFCLNRKRSSAVE